MSLDEFGLIRRLTEKVPTTGRGVEVGCGDDAAVLAYGERERTVVTTDTMVGGRHFLAQTMSPYDIGWKAAAASISDIAAMGGDPRHMLIAIGIPKDIDEAFLDSLYDGIGGISRRFGVAVVGGDVVSTDGPLFINTTLMGAVPTVPLMDSAVSGGGTGVGNASGWASTTDANAAGASVADVVGVDVVGAAGLAGVAGAGGTAGKAGVAGGLAHTNAAGGRALLRSGAQPGHIVFVSGHLGGAQAGLLDLLEPGALPEDDRQVVRGAHQRPIPQVEVGRILLEEGASSCNDVSDGLASELNEIAAASGVRLRIEERRIPIATATRNLARQRRESPLDYAWFGGEDYQLVGTASPFQFARILARCESIGQHISQIGRVLQGDGVVAETAEGELHVVLPKGYNHFR